jgi:hypothetical protein
MGQRILIGPPYSIEKMNHSDMILMEWKRKMQKDIFYMILNMYKQYALSRDTFTFLVV